MYNFFIFFIDTTTGLPPFPDVDVEKLYQISKVKTKLEKDPRVQELTRPTDRPYSLDKELDSFAEVLAITNAQQIDFTGILNRDPYDVYKTFVKNMDEIYDNNVVKKSKNILVPNFFTCMFFV